MTMVMKDRDTEKPVWEGVSSVNLSDHISIIQDQAANGGDEAAMIEKVLPSIVDRRFTDSSPPWKIVVLPMPSRQGTAKPRCFIANVCSHSIADGGSGFVFHRTFLDALRQTTQEQDESITVTVPDRPLPEPFDTPERLPISPDFMRSIASANVVDAGTWTGSPVFLEPQEGLHTRIRVLEVEAPLVQGALRASRAHNAKLTATLHQLVVRGLSRAVTDRDVTNFASQTAIDLRGPSGAGLAWGVFVSGLAASHPRVDASKPVSADMWAAASSMSEKLAESSARLENQVIGVLRFVPSHKESMVSKLGAKRDGSYALSNILAFDGSGRGNYCRISKMVMASSAAVPSAPLSFCIVSVKDGSLICTVSWQPGALGCPLEKEASFVDEICSSLRGDFEALAAIA
jgi:Alcohol acetyltransferase